MSYFTDGTVSSNLQNFRTTVPRLQRKMLAIWRVTAFWGIISGWCVTNLFLFLGRIRSRGRRLRARDGVCCDQGQPSGAPLHRPVRRLLLQRPDGGRGPVLVDAVRRLHRIHQDDGLLQTEQPSVETQSFRTHDESVASDGSAWLLKMINQHFNERVQYEFATAMVTRRPKNLR